MTHDEAIRAVSRKTGFSQAVVKEIIHALRDTWLCYLEATRETIQLYHFGTFRVVQRQARVIKSPFLGKKRDGEVKSAEIPAYKVLQFRPSIHVKRLLNPKEDQGKRKRPRKKSGNGKKAKEVLDKGGGMTL